MPLFLFWDLLCETSPYPLLRGEEKVMNLAIGKVHKQEMRRSPQMGRVRRGAERDLTLPSPTRRGRQKTPNTPNKVCPLLRNLLSL